MKILYFDLGMGAAGDMLSSALLDLFPDREKIVNKLNSFGIPGVEYVLEKAVKCGIVCSHISVLVHGKEEDEHDHDHEHHHDHDHEHHHEHSAFSGIEHIIRNHSSIPDDVKDDVMAVYSLLAEAESRVHGVPVTEVHFHEVGSLDAVADVAAFCCLLKEIAPDKIVVSPVNVGSGTVKCAHGILPVPAPATCELLKGIPSYSSGIKCELCTPTGAALIKRFAQSFGEMPLMTLSGVGCGAGKKDLERANVVRAFVGESGEKTGEIAELETNVDDMTPEETAFACQTILEEGALDVFTLDASMKKGRPGTLIRVLCEIKDREKIVECIFRHTSTLGIREVIKNRYVLDRRVEEKETAFGKIRIKKASGYGASKTKYEYDDLSRIAKETGKSLFEIKETLEKGE